MNIDWNDEKNDWLVKHRNLSFGMVMDKIINNDILDDVSHPNNEKYPNQFIFIIEIDAYCYTVPYVETSEGVFLKTIIPSRKMTKLYLGAKNENYR